MPPLSKIKESVQININIMEKFISDPGVYMTKLT